MAAGYLFPLRRALSEGEVPGGYGQSNLIFILEKGNITLDHFINGTFSGSKLNDSVFKQIKSLQSAEKNSEEKVKEIEKYIAEEQDVETKEKLILLKDKIQGVYAGSKQEARELNLKDETQSKYNLLTRAIKEKRKVKILY